VNCLGRQPRVPFGAQVALDLAGLDSVHRSVAEEGSQMAAQVATVVGDRRALALHHLLEVRDVGITRLADGPPLALGHHGRRVDEPAQLALGLCAREAIGIADAALRPDLALDAGARNAPGARTSWRARRGRRRRTAARFRRSASPRRRSFRRVGMPRSDKLEPYWNLGRPPGGKSNASTACRPGMKESSERTKGPARRSLSAVDGGAVTSVAGG